VSRFTTSILLATALLGVLLWIVVSIVVDLANAPDQPLPMPEEKVEIFFDPALRRISTRASLVTYLNEQGYSGETLVTAYGDWLEDRGYPPAYNWITDRKVNAADSTGTPDDAELLLIAGSGNIPAMHELAERSLATDDPLEALAWYDRAIVSGSLYAMLRTADLITTLTDPALAEFISNPGWQAALNQLRTETPPPVERALGWSLAAVSVGGYGVMDSAHARRIRALTEQLEPAEIDKACEISQNYVLEAAAVRRVQGGAIFSAEQPPMAVSIAAPSEVIPCDIPVLPLVSLQNCKRRDFVGPGPMLMSTWVCAR
jgi:hypothetical protein